MGVCKSFATSRTQRRKSKRRNRGRRETHPPHQPHPLRPQAEVGSSNDQVCLPADFTAAADKTRASGWKLSRNADLERRSYTLDEDENKHPSPAAFRITGLCQ